MVIKIKQDSRSFLPPVEKFAHFDSIKDAADTIGVTHAAVKAAANYGTKSGGFYWLRDDSLSTEEEFCSVKPNDCERLNRMNKTHITKDGRLLYSASSKHLIPKFKDKKGEYWFISDASSKHVKFYK